MGLWRDNGSGEDSTEYDASASGEFSVEIAKRNINMILTKSNQPNRVKRSPFTLIELLIVIGLLGALTALILPSLMANREEALGDVCDYNQAGTVRVLKQFKQVFNHYPVGMHTGLQSNAATPLAMGGLPSAQEDHMGNPNATTPVTCPSVHELTANQAKSLTDAGIESVCYNVGYESEDIATGVYVVRANNGAAWLDDSPGGGVEMTFDGVSLTNWESATGTPSWDKAEGNGVVVVLWIAPTIDWEHHPEMNKNNDWTKGEVKMGIDLQGKCPIPAEDIDGGDPEFAYYMAYFKVYNNGAPARLIGTTCPECGILNP